MRLEGFAGRGVLVTGAGSSVGRCIAERFLAEGARVHVADISADFVARTLREVPGLSGSVADLGRAADVEALFGTARAGVGEIDFLVNCVGIAGPAGRVEELSGADWRTTFDVNVHGVFETMRLAIPGMKQRRFGAIVNFSTASTRTGLPSRTPYVASKAAVEALTYTAARELGPHDVRCNAILPGPINNDRMNAVIERNAREKGVSFEAMQVELLRYVSMHTRVEPDELADMVLYLCSHSGRHITGQMIEVSGNLEWEG
jgi:NAD(P)-dependent dehydrogenase (short-subunit alcohol dehydrogenase family)